MQFIRKYYKVGFFIFGIFSLGLGLGVMGSDPINGNYFSGQGIGILVVIIPVLLSDAKKSKA
jgi:hypothetical protein